MKIYKEAKSNFLVVGKKYYIVAGEDKKGNSLFKEAPRDKYIFFTTKIIPKLRKSVNVDKVLWGALSKMSLEELAGLYERLYKGKRKPKPKQKDGCLYLKVGKYRVDLQS